MNRELKARVWDSEEKKMWYPQDIVTGKAGKFRIGFVQSLGFLEATLIREDNTYFVWRGAVTMYSTGLKDKNGKEIYEGDIVNTIHYLDIQIGAVEWWRDRWVMSYKGIIDGTVQYQSLMAVETPYVIGNIYENPELLNSTENAK